MRLSEFVKEKNIDVTSLPSSIKKKISVYNQILSEYKDIAEEYEKDEDDGLGKELQELDFELDALDKQITKEITQYLSNKKPKPVKENTEVSEPIEVKKEEQGSDKLETENEPTEKKGKGFGWLGFVALGLLTAGAYWVYSKDKEN